jgi:beta-glucanase (GH16 family)
MKNTLKYRLIALMALTIAACSPQEIDDYSMGSLDTVTLEQITFSVTPSETSANKITFTNTSQLKIPYAVSWDLGNGATGKGDAVTGIYPMKGDYTVSMTLYAPDGSGIIKSYNLVLENDDFSLVSSPAYVQLTGGIENPDGKTWVFDQYNNFAKEVADATGKDIKGHMGLGPAGSSDHSWWGAGYDEKSAAQPWVYEFKFTFKQAGTQLVIQNGGKGLGRWACASGLPGATQNGDDAIFDYIGGSYTFSITEAETEDAYSTLTLSGGAILGYYACNLTYDIIYQTEEVIALRVLNTTENQDWVFIFIREDLNVATPPAPPKTELKAVPLLDDFEGVLSVDFVQEEMGGLSAAGYQNPAPVPVNPSEKVYLYQKSLAYYSNLSFTTSDYLFDLTEQNKIRMKVYIPSYNDYTTENGVAGDWIANKKLLPQVAVKLQNSSLGGNAWQTQTELIHGDLEKDKWLELEFDFSVVAARQDYDKIVIQFGMEGHAGPGIFFFDDFSFTDGKVENDNSNLPVEGYTLVWNDEFNQSETKLPNTSNWSYETGAGGWGNNELQNYIPAVQGNDTCASVYNGSLKIVAKKSSSEVLSVRMNTIESWTYGYFEARLKLPSGKGTWPAFWMMPKTSVDGWPNDGEIDIMEHVGYRPNYVSSSIHCKSYYHGIGTQKTAEKYVLFSQSAFHVYGLEWTPDYIRGFIDGEQYFEFLNDKTGNKDTWPFNTPFYLKLNLAWGGNWGGAEGVNESALPATYEIDYVRVYQK